MTNKPYGVGIVGCGEIAQLTHIPIIAELPELHLAALCDLSRKVMDTLGAQYGVSALYADYADLIADPAVDIVVICTFDHAPVIEAVLAAGKAFTVEKPLAFTAAEVRSLVERAEAAGTTALVGYMKLFDPGYVEGLAQLQDVTDIKAVQVHNFAGRFDRYQELYTQVRGNDVDQAVIAKGLADVDARIEDALGSSHAGYRDLYKTLLMLGSHNLAVMRGAFGVADKVEFAKAIGPSHIYALLRMPGNLDCAFEVAYGPQYEWWDEWIHAWGLNKELRINFPNPYVRNHAAKVTLRHAVGLRPATTQIEGLPDTAFRQQWLHFIAVMKGNVENRSPLRGGLADLELAEKIIKSLPDMPKAV